MGTHRSLPGYSRAQSGLDSAPSKRLAPVELQIRKTKLPFGVALPSRVQGTDPSAAGAFSCGGQETTTGQGCILAQSQSACRQKRRTSSSSFDR